MGLCGSSHFTSNIALKSIGLLLYRIKATLIVDQSNPSEMSLVEKWGARSFDLKDPLGRFKRSEFNYFLKDKSIGLVAGY